MKSLSLESADSEIDEDSADVLRLMSTTEGRALICRAVRECDCTGSTKDELLNLGTSIPLSELILHLVSSKRQVDSLTTSEKIGIVVPMWKETERLKPRTQVNPTGESCLVSKIESLAWLFEGSKFSWHLYAVDDGCPDESWKVASKSISESPFCEQVSVLRLADFLPCGSAPLSRLQDAQASMKGGALCLGMIKAVEDRCDLVGYTDCDNSVHLGQLGLLIQPLLNGDCDAALGTRVGGGAFLNWNAKREDEGKILLHVRRLIFREKLPTTDVPSPLKLFRSSVVAEALKPLGVFDFTFDLHLLLSLMRMDARILTKGYVFLDSFSNSTWHSVGHEKIVFQKLKGLLSAIDCFNYPHDAKLMRILRTYFSSLEQVSRALKCPTPYQLENCRLEQMGDPTMMSTDDVEAWCKKNIPLPSKLGRAFASSSER